MRADLRRRLGCLDDESRTRREGEGRRHDDGDARALRTRCRDGLGLGNRRGLRRQRRKEGVSLSVHLVDVVHRECTDDALSARTSATSKAWISDVAFGLGVAGVGLGVWVLLSGRRGEPATRVAVRSTTDGGGMRVSVDRSF